MNAAKTRTARIAKASQKHALLTLAQIAEMGEVTGEQVFAAMPGRKGEHCTMCRCWDLVALGCLEGHGQHPDFAKGTPLSFTVTDLGRAVLSWR